MINIMCGRRMDANKRRAYENPEAVTVVGGHVYLTVGRGSIGATHDAEMIEKVYDQISRGIVRGIENEGTPGAIQGHSARKLILSELPRLEVPIESIFPPIAAALRHRRIFYNSFSTDSDFGFDAP
eukprot:CAMPEP_0178991700 /NCGR_PEP_ID=MMETSP0795-20121207/5681_1 /TAXON_ID=88552 /ORGANISM="Amoebophrya sp., Strain Ameob2" /LENGTH=125 /DNA_ID=CAMNT_0020683453 /DNA_START=200 /DNA_END=577 /DNA_ORIENTATION=-